jgi:hypothetical protein
MKEYFYAKVDFVGSSPTLWIVLSVAALMCVFFFVRQMYFLPLDSETVKEFVLDESKGKAKNFKHYFPKPYSVSDLARGDHDKH